MILLTLLYYICHIIIQERLVIMVFQFQFILPNHLRVNLFIALFDHKTTSVYEEGTSATLKSGIHERKHISSHPKLNIS